MRYVLGRDQCRNLAVSARKEWLLTNGLGGFSMGTASEIATRRYHGLLVAATESPATRMVLLASVECSVHVNASEYGISCNQYPGAVFPQGYQFLDEFSVGTVARWKFKGRDFEIWRSVGMTEGENTVTIQYANRGKTPVSLFLRPLVCHKPYHDNFYESSNYPAQLSFARDETIVGDKGVSLYLGHKNAFRNPVQGWYYRFEHQVEIERGLPSRDDLYCPCQLEYALAPGQSVALVASTKANAKALALDESEQSKTTIPIAPNGDPKQLTLALKSAAEKFVVKSKARTSIIAGYPWFTDWGRDTMISLPGIYLATGRDEDARQLLRDYAKQMQKGIIPNRFVEAGEEPQYNTVDATLWYVDACYRTLGAKWDDDFAGFCDKVFKSIFEWHEKGTLHGIRIDPADGLLTQGEAGDQLTWMDAKIGDWVVTPRHGKPVEICGLWINATRIMEWLANRIGSPDKQGYAEAGAKAEESFEKKFWAERLGFYLDTVDPDDGTLRPNQLIAMSLPFSPVNRDHANSALSKIEQALVTPRGLRTLSPANPNYHGRYEGPLPQMDAAYHQGTAWPWLLGPYLSACKRVRGSAPNAEEWISNFWQMLGEGGLGGIAEVYDGDEPQRPNGCPWQAWSVGELLRVLTEVL